MPINKRFFHYGARICMNLYTFSDTYFWCTIIPHDLVLYKDTNLILEWGMGIKSNIPDEATVKTLRNVTQYSNSLTTISRLSTQWNGKRYTNLQHILMITHRTITTQWNKQQTYHHKTTQNIIPRTGNEFMQS